MSFFLLSFCIHNAEMEYSAGSQAPPPGEDMNWIPPSIREAGHEYSLEGKKPVISQGDAIHSVHILLEGEMRVFNAFGNGRVYTIAALKPGTFIGSYELIGGRKNYSSTIDTVCKCRIFRIRAESFLEWYRKDNKLAREMARQLAVSVCENSERSGEVLVYPGQYILGEFLIRRFENGNDDFILLKQNRQQIADTLGLSIRTVNRSIQSLKAEGALRIVKGKIGLDSENIQLLRNLNNKIKKNL